MNGVALLVGAGVVAANWLIVHAADRLAARDQGAARQLRHDLDQIPDLKDHR